MKIFTVDFPEKAPGKCALCGANHQRDGRKYIDFGMTIPRYGVVYWCTLCITELVNILGWINPAQANELKDYARETKHTISDLREENDKLRRALSELDFLDPSLSDNIASVESSQGDSKDERSGDIESESTSGESDEDKQGSIESSDEQRSSGVFSVDLASSV